MGQMAGLADPDVSRNNPRAMTTAQQTAKQEKKEFRAKQREFPKHAVCAATFVNLLFWQIQPLSFLSKKHSGGQDM